MANVRTDQLLRQIQIHIPFNLLYEQFLSEFIAQGFNPEVGLSAEILDRFNAQEFKKVADRIHAHGLDVTLHAPFIDLSAGSPDEQIRELTRRRFQQVLDLLPIFKPKTVIGHAGYDFKRHWYFKDKWLANSLESWHWFGQHIQAAGAQLMLENVYEHGPEEIVPLIAGLNRQGVKFCLDTGHQAVFGQVPLKKWIAVIGPYIGQLHLHDNNGSLDEHLALGQGGIDFAFLLDQLKKILDRPPVVTLEIRTAEDLQASIIFLKSIWPW